MEYRVIRSESRSDDAIEHAIFGGGRQKGAQNKNHKYLARAWWRNKWRYAYTEAEVKALQMLGKVKETASDVKETTKELSTKVKGTANVAAGRAKKAVDTAKNTVEKTAYNASKAAKEVANDVKSGTTAKQVAIKAETAKNDIKNTANKVSNSAKAAAEKVTSTAKTVTEKGKAKAEELLSNAKKENTSSSSPTRQAPSSSEVTRGRKYEGTGHKAEARKEEGGVAGGPVSGNTNMDNRGQSKTDYSAKDEIKNMSLKDKAKLAVDAVKVGAEIKKKSFQSYLDGKEKEALNGTSVANEKLLGKKVVAHISESNDLFNKTTIKEVKDENGHTSYEVHTSYGKLAQGAKAVDDLIDKGKAKVSKYLDVVEGRPRLRDSQPSSDSSDRSAVEKGKVKDTANSIANKVSSAAAKAYDKVTDEIEKVRESDAVAAINNTANKVKDKVTDTAEKVADKVADVKATTEHKAYANEMKRKYGADSLHYQDAQAYVEHDKAVSDLQKARNKYGVNSAEYKAAVAKEKAAREKMDDVHEQNLYTNNKEYKKVSDQASALESYIRNMDARGGPQTAEGKANYRKAVQDLEKLEAELERMWNEDWE